MRKIIHIITSTLLLAGPVYAVDYDFSATSSSGVSSPDATDIGLSADIESASFNLSANDIRFGEKWSMSLGMTSQYFDGEEIFFYDEQANKTPISTLGIEPLQWTPSLTLSYDIKENLTLSTNAGKSLNNSILSSESAGVGIVGSFLNKATVFGLSANYRKQSSPVSTYKDENYQDVSLPTEKETIDASLTLEQHLHKNLKVGLETQYVFHKKIRSDTVVVIPSVHTALSSRAFANFRYEFYKDIKNYSPTDGRGYLDMQVYHLGVTLEPVYDFLVSLSYDMIVEREENIIQRKIERVGADQFGLGFLKIGEEIDLSLKGALTNSSTYALGYQFEGGMTWRL